MEGLSRLFLKAKEDGLIQGVKVSNDLFLNIILFVDDVIILGRCSVAEWSLIKELLNLFCSASGLSFSRHKYFFRHNCFNELLVA